LFYNKISTNVLSLKIDQVRNSLNMNLRACDYQNLFWFKLLTINSSRILSIKIDQDRNSLSVIIRA